MKLFRQSRFVLLSLLLDVSLLLSSSPIVSGWVLSSSPSLPSRSRKTKSHASPCRLCLKAVASEERERVLEDAVVSPEGSPEARRLFEMAGEFDLPAYVKEKLPRIEAALDKSIPKVSSSPRANPILESMRYSLLAPAKRIRPVLCLAACELFGGSEKECMASAVALEMIHTMSLIHDDLPAMDNESLRRGIPTNHVKFGENVAILAGDALLSESFKHVAEKAVDSETAISPAIAAELIVKIGEAVGPEGLAGGQTADVECEGKSGVSLEDLLWIHRKKTAVLLRASCGCGALVGGAGPEDVDRLEGFAERIGLAFQIRDDILDLTQSSEELGKTAGKDVNVSKTTYPKLKGLEWSRREAENLVAQAIELLVPFGERAVPLAALARFIVERKN